MSGARICAFTLLACASLLLGACGGGDREGTGAAPEPGASAAEPGVLTYRAGDDSIQTWGHGAPPAQRERLTAFVRGYLGARAAREWTAVCARLAARQRAEQGLLAGGKSCARAMESFAARAPDATLRREARIEVLSVRVGPLRGRLYSFVIYRRPDGVWATALTREAGRWKIVTVTPQQLS